MNTSDKLPFSSYCHSRKVVFQFTKNGRSCSVNFMCALGRLCDSLIFMSGSFILQFQVGRREKERERNHLSGKYRRNNVEWYRMRVVTKFRSCIAGCEYRVSNNAH